MDKEKYIQLLKKSANMISELKDRVEKLENQSKIAIVGYACRFPGGANNTKLYWEKLVEGFDAVTTVPIDRFDYKKYYRDETNMLGKSDTCYASFLDTDIKSFDNGHFEISANEAKSMDPQHRLLMEVCWEALENSGIDYRKLKGSTTGVFVGIDSMDYFKSEMGSGDMEDIGPYSLMGVSQHSAAGRIAYYFDLKGPTIVCNTACSSSLVALNSAVESLQSGKCDFAIVGGVNLLLNPEAFVGLSSFHSLAPDGRCKTFDQSADGFGRGEGCGVVLLQRLEDARESKRNVEAIVRASYVGQDGKSNGFYAPNGLAETRVIKKAMEIAKIKADEVDYVETHGTGTTLGDFIEAQAISDAFSGKKEKMLVGAVKSNMGHLEAASGIAGLIKVLLSMKHGKIPPSIHFKEPNENIDWAKIQVVDKLINWDKKEGMRIAGVNSFGISGTLAHVIVEEYKDREREYQHSLTHSIITLSGKNQAAIKGVMAEMAEYLEETDLELSDIAYTSNITKSFQKYRYAVVGKEPEEIIEEIRKSLRDDTVFSYNTGKNSGKKYKTAFLFTGQGSIYKNIGKQFFESYPKYKECFLECDRLFKDTIGISVCDAAFDDSISEEMLLLPKYSQALLFSVEYSLTKLWNSLGIHPEVVIGHSIGEYVAACYAGYFSLEEAVYMISLRINVLESIDEDGKMMGVLSDFDTVCKAIEETGCKNVSVAAVNAEKNVTISGLENEVDQTIKQLQLNNRVFVNDLKINKPYHSVVMEKYEDKYNFLLGKVTFSKGNIKMISTVTGNVAAEKTICNADYWGRHLSQTVRFLDAISVAEKMGINTFIELGGNATLCGMTSQCLANDEIVCVPSMRKSEDDIRQLLDSLKRLYLDGYDMQWDNLYSDFKHKKVYLPNHVFNRKKLWKDMNVVKEQSIIENKDMSNNLMESDTINNTNKEEITSANKRDKIKAEVLELIKMITGMNLDEIDTESDLFSFGFDSLLLITLGKQIGDRYHVNIPMDIFFTELNTIDKIIDYLVENAIVSKSEISKNNEEGKEFFNDINSNIAVNNTINNSNNFDNSILSVRNNTSSGLETIFQEQLRIIAEQNEILKNMYTGSPVKAPANVSFDRNEKNIESILKNEKPSYYVPYQKLAVSEREKLQELQDKYVHEIIEKYTSITQKSKENTSKYRYVNANARHNAGFRPIFKEMLYQLVAQKGKGSKIVDIDGNEILDITMGFGVNMFGHAPEFVRKSLLEEIELGLPLGPMGRLTGQVAESISELTGAERVFFCNSGTEADMFAIRIARAKTGKKKIVSFQGSYHGTYDGILGLPYFNQDGSITSMPMAPGITESSVNDLIVLKYDDEKSLKYIEEHSDEIAGVLVEVVQSRRPDIQPKEFLQKLRSLTKNKDIALIFDEIITGFRISAGGAQEYFGINADIITYGKVIGGGMPIGVVAGIEEYMNSVDGGVWNFGDNSVPEYDEKRTYAMGTFCHHPMTMAAANATLNHIKENKNDIYPRLNEKTDNFIKKLNKFFIEEKIPFSAYNFGSLFRINVAREHEIFFYGLVAKGIYVWEGRNCFLSTEHGDEDIDKIINAVKNTALEMKEAGFFDDSKDPNDKKKKKEENKLKESDSEEKNRSGIKKSFDLSLIQERLYTEALIKESNPFDIVSAYKVKGNLNLVALENAIKKVIHRQEMLRTTIKYEDAKISQHVMENWEFSIKEYRYSSNDKQDAINAFITKFDLAQAPLLEVLYIRLGSESDFEPEEKLLVFHFHHIASDGISMNIFVQELLSIYAGKTLSPLKKQYSDFVKWEQEYLKTEKILEEKKFFDEMLKDATTVLPLPYDNPKYLQKTYAGNTLVAKVPKEKLDVLKKIASTNKASLFMLLLASVNILLYKLSGEENFAVTTPVSNRFEGGFDDVIGMFTNTVAISSSLDDTMTFSELVNRTKGKCIQVYGKMNYPYNMLIQELQKNKKDPFNINFVYENINSRSPQHEGVIFEPYDYTPAEQEFELTFEFLEEKDELGLYIRYQRELFNEGTIQLLMDRINILFNKIIAEENCLIGDIDLLTEGERKQILYDFNNTDCEYPRNETILSLFEKQVEKSPENIAVQFGKEQIIYAELNERANFLGQKLRRMGVKRDDFVAILSERSIEMIIAIYAVLKAGGAYVPMDPSHPEERIQFMLENCEPKALLLYKDDIDTSIVKLNLEDEDNRGVLKDNLSHVNSPNDLAYCIYTSGTTGKPKGVLIQQHNVVRLMNNSNFQFNFSEDDVWTMFHSYCFDFSVWEMYGASLFGGKLIVISKEDAQDSHKLMSIILDEGVTVLNQVPSSFYNLMKYDRDVEKNKLRYVIFGGEALNPAKLKYWYQSHPGCKLINMYGITETTVHVTYREIGIDEINRGISDIGNAIPTLKVYIMKNDKMCGIGVPGELCVVGEGIARGYLKRPELTSTKFVANPFGEGMMYRSGDLARWMADGNIEYLGRIDEQVKIRGYRIELGEIENKIREIDYVKDCVVVKKDNAGEGVLCAYIVSDRQIDAQNIKSTISNTLPLYMIPSYIIQLDKIPTTENGKLNRKALPDIVPSSIVKYTAPQNEIQQIICDIYQEVLDIEKVGIMDDFFELGGHSLRATGVINQIEVKTGRQLEIKSIFQYRTPKDLAYYIDSLKQSQYKPIPKAEKKDYYDMSSVQKRIYIIQEINPDSTVYNMTQCIRVNGSVDEARMNKAIRKIVERHEILRTGFFMHEACPVQAVLPDASPVLEKIEADTSEFNSLIDDFVRPYDLSKAPLIRIRLVKGESDSIIMFDMHHIISDGMSIGIIIREFMELYHGHELPALTCQYKDYSEWTRNLDFSRQKEYWINQFRDEIPVLNIPYDYSRPSEQSFAGGQVSTYLSEELTARIEKYVKENSMTDFMAFLGSVMILMEKYSHQNDIVIGTTISGRTHKDMESMIGMFVNTLAMRAKPDENKDVGLFMQEIKEIALQAYENQDFLFEELVESIDIKKDISHNPLFDVMLVLQNNEKESLSFDGNKVEYLETKNLNSKFDLTFNIEKKDKQYEIALEYCSDLFLEETAENMLKHYIFVIEQLVNRKATFIKEIETAYPKEKEKIISVFNDTWRDYPKDKSIKDLFEEQTLANTNKIALIFEDKKYSFSQLNKEANSLSHKLLELGLGQGDVIALLSEKSHRAVIAILAIIKIGGVYVPIDTKYPRERISYVIKDCNPKLLICSGVSVETDVEVLDINNSEAWTGNYENPDSKNLSSEDEAYYMYTSGTTGEPKGSIIMQKSILRLVKNNEFLELDKSTIMAMTGSIAFDAATLEIWGPLLNGGTLVVLKNEILINPSEFKECIQKTRINTMWLTSALFNQMIMMEEDMFDSLKYLLIGGEKLSDYHVRKFKERNNSVILINGYGPTENTTFTTTYVIPNTFDFIPIGKPISNSSVYIMRNNQLCGIGVPGELCASGDGLSKGYLNREDLTREKFVKNPYGETELYRTGDLARWLPDGNVDYLGRIDEQVKLRGFRIELREVEEKLMACQNIKDAVVILNKEKKALFAYIVSDMQINMEDLSDELGKKLPDYMIPSYIMQMEQIPLTSNGKVDKRSLPGISFKSTREYIAPSTDRERALCDVLISVLNVEKIGIKDRFFELGGDSIKAIRVVSALRDLGYEIDFIYLMKNSSVQEIAEYMKEGKGILWEQGEIVGEVPDTPIVRMFKELNLSKPNHYNQAVILKINTKENIIREALGSVINHHDMLRAIFVDGKLIIRDQQSENLLYFENKNIMRNIAESIENYANKVQESMELEKGPLVKAINFETEEGQILLICIHHLLVDGISWRIILSDLNLAVESIEKGEEVKLPFKTASYIEWANALEKYKESYGVRKELEYWHKVLSEVDSAKFEGDKGAADTKYIQTYVDFSEEDTTNLLFNCNHAYNTEVNDLLLAAFAKTTKKISGQKKVAIKLEGHGREQISEDIDVDRTVGWFTSIYPLILECSDEISECIINTKEVLRKIPKHGIGFGILSDEFPKKEIDICFNYMGQVDAEFNEENLCNYSVGDSISKENKLNGNLNFDGIITGGKLRFDLTYDRGMYSSELINKMANAFRNTLIEIISFCMKEKSSNKTLSDYGTVEIEKSEFDEIMDMFD